MKKIHFLLFILIFNQIISCKKKNNTDLISNKFKIDFLVQILSDTTESKLLNDKRELVSNFTIVVPPSLPIDPINKNKSINLSQYISDTLNINDIEFVKQQFIDNKRFSFNQLSNKGFNVIDIEKYYSNNIKWDSINKIASNYYKKENMKKYFSYLSITKPIFNRELNLAYVRIRLGSGGMSRIYKKVNGTWDVKYEFDEYVE
ncbi:hypothetical protein OOZ35_01775 [Mesoflavibacter profundi]|uniref:Uncharacterized protein n=1 Tax=Mesoflavibacter profundi TaxID=2708110 RepID=A0ABT4RWL1_9FLAO|nr:hypothetical protein [Mesoflavibacter profundi]MDA0176213.1 hypothetical protein [Mesoflavibacter profundi]